MLKRIKYIPTFVLFSFISLSHGASSQLYEGKMISYNDKEFKVSLIKKNGTDIKKQEKYFPKKYLSEGQLENISKLVGKRISFKVPLLKK
ncbi:MAG: hypothetical protein CME65_05725 [Halobacteriovoraceae bacterium]|nr:hypothetical protein [Halobacteriovoraceae bacterium]|tara:strand:- start:11558 stop:11827 length:270 start_codon:yes stop_codon:yes gene_type:complete